MDTVKFEVDLDLVADDKEISCMNSLYQVMDYYCTELNQQEVDRIADWFNRKFGKGEE